MNYLNRAATVNITCLSASGLYYSTEYILARGQHIWVILDLPKAKAAVRAIIRRDIEKVVNRKKIYGAGVQFIRSPLAEAGLSAVIAHLSELAGL